jgi:hypothetical protein
MRSILAVLLAVAMLALAGAPHAHAHAVEHDAPDCAACAMPRAAMPSVPALDLAPAPVVEATIELAPPIAPVTGAPLGAIPGQSPPSP